MWRVRFGVCFFKKESGPCRTADSLCSYSARKEGDYISSRHSFGVGCALPAFRSLQCGARGDLTVGKPGKPTASARGSGPALAVVSYGDSAPAHRVSGGHFTPASSSQNAAAQPHHGKHLTDPSCRRLHNIPDQPSLKRSGSSKAREVREAVPAKSSLQGSDGYMSCGVLNGLLGQKAPLGENKGHLNQMG